MMAAIDTHTHLDMLGDLDEQIDEARQVGVTRWVLPGVDPSGWPLLIALAEKHSGVFAAPGIHPQAADRCSPAALEVLRDLLVHPEVVAVGEVGLDSQVAIDKFTQERTFVEMICQAKENGKPLLIHNRKGTERILELLHQEAAQQVGGIFHAFSGSLETARKILDLGFVLGIGGVVTWPTARKLPEIVANLPVEALVLETDAPFMTPAPFQGQANRPAYLKEIIERIAELKGWSVAEVIKITSDNARRVLKLPPEEC